MPGQSPNNIFLTTQTADQSPENPEFSSEFSGAGLRAEGGGGKLDVPGSRATTPI